MDGVATQISSVGRGVGYSDTDGALSKDSISPDEVSPLFLRKVPIGYARRFGVLGLTPASGCMPVAVKSTQSIHALDKITVLLGLSTAPVLVDESTLVRAINQAYGLKESGVETVIE